jgi:exosortase/archaeosortase family protein
LVADARDRGVNRRRLEIMVIISLCIAAAYVGFRTLIGVTRRLEVDGATALMNAFGSNRVSPYRGTSLQVLPFRGFPFRAYVTPYCSALIAILTLACIALFILKGPLWKRLTAFLVAALGIFACNVLRIALSVYVGLHLGSASLSLFHDWVGTIASFLYTMGGFFLMLSLLLPSAKDKKLVRAARVSDTL